MLGATALSLRGYFHSPRVLDCVLLATLLLTVAFAFVIVKGDAVVNEEHYLFSNQKLENCMYSLSPISFLQTFLLVELQFEFKSGTNPSPVDFTAVSHIQRAKYLTDTTVLSLQAFNTFGESVVIFKDLYVQSGFFSFNLRFRGNLSQFDGYILRSTRGRELWQVWAIWFKSIFCLISFCVAVLYHSTIRDAVRWSALSNPLNLQRILCFVSVIVNFPDLLLNCLRFHRIMRTVLASISAIFRTLMSASFSLLHFDRSTTEKAVAVVIVLIFLTGIEFRANLINPLEPAEGYAWAMVREIALLIYFAIFVIVHLFGWKLPHIEQLLDALLISSRLVLSSMRLLFKMEPLFVGNLIWDNASTFVLVATTIPSDSRPLDLVLPEEEVEATSVTEELFLPVEEYPPALDSDP
jgi:hypothetical protein